MEPDGSLDLESIHALDVPCIQEHLSRLLAGEEVQTPRFSFKAGKREQSTVPMRLPEGEPLIVEGIHGLNPLLSEGLPRESVHRIFVSALTCMNLDDHNRIRTTDVRLLRPDRAGRGRAGHHRRRSRCPCGKACARARIAGSSPIRKTRTACSTRPSTTSCRC